MLFQNKAFQVAVLFSAMLAIDFAKAEVFGQVIGTTPAQGAGIGAGVAAAGRGQYNLDTSQATENLEQARGQSIDNHNYAVSSYYANKDAHDAYVAAHKDPSLSQSQIRQNAKIGTPARLSTTQLDRSTNVIHWPPLLRDSEFTKEREALDQLFDQRTPDDSGADSDNYVSITQATEAMHQTLVKKLRAEDLPAVTFIGAQHFIKSLAYEGRFTAK